MKYMNWEEEGRLCDMLEFSAFPVAIQTILGILNIAVLNYSFKFESGKEPKWIGNYFAMSLTFIILNTFMVVGFAWYLRKIMFFVTAIPLLCNAGICIKNQIKDEEIS